MRVVIVGAGLAGGRTALALRQKGFEGAVTLIGAEGRLPYHRPLLSKSYLDSAGALDGLWLRGPEVWAENDIELRIGSRIEIIDRAGGKVIDSDGGTYAYDHLVLATGARNRSLAAAEGAFGLRTLDDAGVLNERLIAGTSLVVVGGGFTGLELAAAASKRAVRVTVIEGLDHLMSRAISRDMAQFIEREHVRHGVEVVLSQRVERIAQNVVEMASGESFEADTVVVGVGVAPNVELASSAGLAVDDGIVVNEVLRTADEQISAIGDSVRYPCPFAGRMQRLESVQNAIDQARCVALNIAGTHTPYGALPWFWTEQYGHRLQIAGVAQSSDPAVPAKGHEPDSFSVYRFNSEGLVAVESLNRIPDHAAARKLLTSEAGSHLTPEEVADPSFDPAKYIDQFVH